MTVKEFIKDNFKKTIRENKVGNNRLIGLPYPYTVPCISNSFQEMYYWDTYFTNKGLILIGNTAQAVNNVKNFAYLIEKFGYVPNGNITDLLNRSQPPFFGAALSDVLPYLQNEELKSLVAALKKEYKFWTEKRDTTIGLNRYGSSANEKDCLDYIDLYQARVGRKVEKTIRNGLDIIAECESGWDFSPRFPFGCENYCPVDLNSLLFIDEKLLSDLDGENKDLWNKRAENRKEKVLNLCKSGDVFFDYCFAKESVSGVFGCNGFFPYFADISNDGKGFAKLLEKLETPFGIVAAETDEKGFQWATPNGWACLFYVCVSAAIKVGDVTSAKRVAQKYISVANSLFEKYGKLYEKYDVIHGGVGASEGYQTPEMMGWTAGIYLAFENYLQTGELI